MPRISAASREEHRAATRERILDAWANLIAVHGYTRVSLRDVAAAAGMARSAVYNYYADRDALLLAHVEREVEWALGRLRRDLADAPSSGERLRRFVRFRLHEFARQSACAGGELASAFDPSTYALLIRRLEPLERVLRQILAQGRARGEFTMDDVPATASMIISLLDGERVPVATGVRDPASAADRVAAFVLRALGATGGR